MHISVAPIPADIQFIRLLKTIFLCFILIILFLFFLFFDLITFLFLSLIFMGMISLVIHVIVEYYILSITNLDQTVTGLNREKQRLDLDLNKAVFELLAIFEFNNVLGNSMDFETMVGLMVDTIKRIIVCDGCCLLIYDEARDEIYTEAYWGFSSKIKQLHLPVNQFFTGNLLEKVLLINDLDLEYPGLRKKQNHLLKPFINRFQSFLSVPMSVQNKAIGFLFMVKEEPNAFAQDALRLLLIIANQAALAIQNLQLYKQVYLSSITDGLTGVYNHKYFRDQLEAMLQNISDYGSDISLIMLDIDHYKCFNDNYGHQVGDQVLIEMTRVIKETVTEKCLVARYGGEEFAIIVPNASKDEGVSIAENIRSEISDHLFVPPSPEFPVLRITVSLGVSSFIEDVHNPKRMVVELIEAADEHLYIAKNNGRNQVCS
jgi:diguanylate cyclase (GGDEF)-like protein